MTAANTISARLTNVQDVKFIALSDATYYYSQVDTTVRVTYKDGEHIDIELRFKNPDFCYSESAREAANARNKQLYDLSTSNAFFDDWADNGGYDLEGMSADEVEQLQEAWWEARFDLANDQLLEVFEADADFRAYIKMLINEELHG